MSPTPAPKLRKSRLTMLVETSLIVVGGVILLAGLTKLAPVAPGIVAALRGLLRPLFLVPLLGAALWFRIARERKRRGPPDQRPN